RRRLRGEARGLQGPAGEGRAEPGREGHGRVRIVGYVGDAALQEALQAAGARLGAEVVTINAGTDGTAANADQLLPMLRTHPDVLVFEVRPELLSTVRSETRARYTCLLAACRGAEQV